MGDRYDYDFNTETHEIVCAECETSPRLKSLDKNSGTVVSCDCDDVKHSLDSVPYEYATHHLPDEWVVVEGRTPKDLAREVDSVLAEGLNECPNCGEDRGQYDRVTCPECHHIPEEYRA